MEPANRLSPVGSNTQAHLVMHADILALCSSQPMLRNRLSVILRNSSYTLLMQLAESPLPLLPSPALANPKPKTLNLTRTCTCDDHERRAALLRARHSPKRFKATAILE